jgi:adenylate cyclase
MSIFFSDIVSFTNISENIAPEKMVLFLNEYFAEMTKIIHQNKGTLDKYIGDSVMCFFNAPISQENHSYFACMTALEQQKKLKELNEKWEKE